MSPPIAPFATSRLRVWPWRITLSDTARRADLLRALPPLLTAEVTAHLPPELTFTQGKDRIEDWITATDASAAVCTVNVLASDTLAGLLLLHRAEAPGDPEINLGYLLGRESWGRGFATELVKGLAVAAAPMAPLRLVAGVDASNTASRRVLEKAGFTPDASRSTPDHITYKLHIS